MPAIILLEEKEKIQPRVGYMPPRYSRVNVAKLNITNYTTTTYKR